MASKEPINLERERGIREGAQLLTALGIADAANVSRDLQDSVDEFFAGEGAHLAKKRRRTTIAEQWAAGLAEGEAEGPF